MKTVISLFALLCVAPYTLFSQCQTNVNFNTWIQEGFLNNGNWSTQGGGTSVNQSINGNPTFYVSPDTFINVAIEGSFRVNTSGDDDYIGFVFGFKDPTGISANYDTYLFSWKRLSQNKYTSTGVLARAEEGMTLAKVSGNISSANDILTYFWGHQNQAGKYEVLGTNYGFTEGWNSFTTYTFQLLYTTTRISIAINNQVIFDIPGCYERGRFGFYNYSQSNVNYSNFSYRLISNFEPDSYQLCENVFARMNFTDSTCTGFSSATNNIASWQWDFGDGTTSTQINPVHRYTTSGPKNIKLIITDINGCQDSTTKTINVNPLPIVDLGADLDKCPNEYLQLNATSPNIINYNWFPGTALIGNGTPTPRTFTPVSTTYIVAATDTSGCRGLDTINVNVHPFLPGVIGFDSKCFGINEGRALAGIQGTAPYEFRWLNSSGQIMRNAVNVPVGADSISNLAPGNYTVFITDANGCDTTLAFTIDQPAAPLLATPDTITDILCNGDSTGGFTVMSTGGTPGYSYSFNGGPYGSQTVYTGLPAGTHFVFVEDANGCRTSMSVTLSEPPALVASVGQQRDIPCEGDSSGYLVINGTGGRTNYMYSLNGGPFGLGNTFTNLSAGTYQVLLEDANGCIDSLTSTLTSSPILDVNLINQIDVNCFGDNTGVLSVQGIGGNPGYRYSLDGVNFQASNTFSNLSAGNYQIIILDDSTCQDTSALFTIQEPIPLAVLDTAQSNVDCNGNNTGNVRLMGSGGNPGYTYSIDGINFQPNPFFVGLAAGNYTVTIQDDSSCTSTLAISIIEPPILTASIASLTNVDCNGNSTGLVSIQAQGGTAPYEYAINGITFSPDSIFPGLAAGNYTITVRDDSSCITTVPVTITEPQPLVETFVGKTDVDCFGNANGSLTVSASGGTMPYMYSLVNVTTFQTSGTFSQLPPTNFDVVVMDAQGCSDTLQINITTPTGLTVNVDSVIHIGCFGDSTGKISLTPSGATAPYQISFDAVNYGPLQLLSGLPAGTYPMRVRDAQNCIAAFSLQISEPAPLTGGLKWQRDVACFGDSSAYIALTASGGQGNYRFSTDSVIFSTDSTLFNLPAGNYNTIILDDSSCHVSFPVTISEPPLLTSTIQSLENISCFGEDDGMVSLASQGGVAPYQYSFDGGIYGSANSFDSLSPGNYLVTALDDSACTVEVPVTILEPDTLVLSILEQINVACNGDSSARITLQHAGGWTPHTYSVNGGSFVSSPVFDDLPIGTYTFTVLDDSSCLDQLTTTVTEPPLLTVALADQLNVDCFGNLTGGFTVTPGGGTPAYAYSIDGVNFDADSIFMGLGAGDYTLTIRDDSSCTQTLGVQITEPDSLMVQALGIDVRCFEGMDGSVSADIQGGTTPYDIKWNTNPVQSTMTINGLSRGNYAVQVVDSLGCTDTSSVFIDHPPLLELALVDSVHPYCDWPNGSISVTASGGVSPNYQYQWINDPSLSEPNATELYEGVYTVVVSDENGCTDTLSVEIFNTPPAIPFFLTDPSYDTTILLSKANIQFINLSEGGVAYLWDFGDGAGGSGEENPANLYSEAGKYPVTLRAFNKYYECPADTTIILDIIPDGALFFANAFTPNGDGYNDVFYFVGEGIVEMEAQIFSRWGRQVAILTNPTDGWNGLMDNTGASLPEGVYTFVMRATLNDGSKIERSGTITLIR